MLAFDHIKLPVWNPETSARFLARVLKTKPPYQDPDTPKVYTLPISSSASIKFYASKSPGSVYVSLRVNELVFGALTQQLKRMEVEFRTKESKLTNPYTGRKRSTNHIIFSDTNGHFYDVYY